MTGNRLSAIVRPLGRLAALGLCVLLAAIPAEARHRKAAPAPFKVFDATLFGADKPDLSAFGLARLPILDGHQLWDRNAAPGGHVPDFAHASAALNALADPHGMVAIDIENWAPVDGQPVSPDAARKNYLDTLAVLRQAAPGMKIGFYGVVPQGDYWNTQYGSDSPRYRAWQRRNDAQQAIADRVDVLFPSLYTFYPKPQAWQVFARANLAEARRLAKGKPVYCFLWFQFHDGTANAYRMLPADYWRMELDTCRQYADGIVIWGGYNTTGGGFHALAWDGDAPWWKATLAFLRDNGIGPSR